MANPILDHLRLNNTTYDLVDSTAIHNLDGYYTSGQTNDAITAATSALAETIAEQHYQTSGDVQSAISGKVDNDTYTAYTASTAAEISGKVANDVYTAYTASTAAELSGKASTGDIVNFFDGAVYEMSGDTHVINFYHGDTVKATINAEDFIADGFLSAVTIENRTVSGESVPCLVFEWNTAAGIQETDIPLSSIFEPDNYYNKTEIDTIVSGINDDISAVSGDVATKQDELTPGDGIQISGNVISVTGAPLTMDDTVTSASTNPVKSSGIYNFVTGETATKQDTLVSGSNIKTINSTSILGSGNIATLQAEVSGTTLILS